MDGFDVALVGVRREECARAGCRRERQEITLELAPVDRFARPDRGARRRGQL
jgi:hypothetical protein